MKGAGRNVAWYPFLCEHTHARRAVSRPTGVVGASSSGNDCGFNRSTQQIVDIVQQVFRSLVFSLGDHLISSQLHLASLASWPKCHFLWGSTVSIARSYFH